MPRCGKNAHKQGITYRQVVDGYTQMVYIGRYTSLTNVYNHILLPFFDSINTRSYPQLFQPYFYLLCRTLSPLSTIPITTTTKLKN